jgi:hypothetical protein
MKFYEYRTLAILHQLAKELFRQPCCLQEENALLDGGEAE